jgi:Mg-chelatase subunit ChlD
MSSTANMDIQAYTIHDNIAYARIRGRQVNHDENRTPIHFCVLLDNSGSMSVNNKMHHVKKSLHYILNMLSSDDYISIVTFSDTTNCCVKRTNASHDNTVIVQHKIKQINVSGGTNLSSGLLATRACLNLDNTHKQGILLLTDGNANEGITTVAGILSITRSLLDEFPGTTLSSVGYGVDHNGEILRAIASEGGGSYNVVQNIDDVATVFGDILGGLVSCAFQQVTLKMPEGATQITKFPGEGLTIRIGDLQAQGDITVLMRLNPAIFEQRIVVDAFDIHELRFINRSINVKGGTNIEMLRHGTIALLRNDVVILMDRVRKAIADSIPDDMRIPLHNEIERLTTAINAEVVSGGTCQILDLLCEELDICTTTLNTQIRSHYEHEHATQIMSQHVAYVGLGRGIRNASTPGRPMDPISPVQTSVFSNSFQRSISYGLRATTSHISDDDEEIPVYYPSPPTMGLMRQNAINHHNVHWPDESPIGVVQTMTPIGILE